MLQDNAQEQVIIVKKKNRHGAAHHGGSWKVAYADFVTSMMAFFLVMWLTVQAPEVKNYISAYFSDPSGFKEGGSKSLLQGSSKSIMTQTGSSVIELNAPSSDPDEDKDDEEERKRNEAQTREKLEQAGETIKKRLEENPDFSAIKNQVDIQMTAEGLRVELVDSSGETFFELGSPDLKSYTRRLLKVIAREVGKLPNKVIIEGHTDNHPYAAQARYTNWELSVDRCNSARRWMVANGLRPDQLHEIRGYADTEPKFKADPSDPRNRRIAIIVVNDYSGMNYLDKNALVKQLEQIANSKSADAPAPAKTPEAKPAP